MPADDVHDSLPERSPQGTLGDLCSGEWYAATLPHPPGPYAKSELLPLVGFGVTITRMIRDEPSLTDTFSGHFFVPLYHASTVSALYAIGSLARRFI